MASESIWGNGIANLKKAGGGSKLVQRLRKATCQNTYKTLLSFYSYK